MLTGKQIRRARQLLRWSRTKFCRNVLMSQASVEAIESSDGPAWLTDEQEASIRRACEGAGVRFEMDAEGKPGAFVPPSTIEVVILHWLANQDHASAPEITAACKMSYGFVRARLAALENLGLVSCRQDRTITPPRSVYSVTGEGRRAAGIVEKGVQDVEARIRPGP